MMIQLVPGRLKKPDWLKARTKLPNKRYGEIKNVVRSSGVATVCEEALCPNIGECWGGGTATFMIMGDTCTRACRFCNVNHGRPNALNNDEPKKLAEAVSNMKLDYVVITSVDRDDVEDGGAAHFAECIRAVKKAAPKMLIEVLTPDFQGKKEDIKKVIEAGPHVFAHNVETVSRLQREVRDHRANYEQSLHVLKYVKKISPKMRTKSSIMVGLGEKPEEVDQAMQDLRAIDCDFLTIGQYLQPSAWNLPVKEYVPPDQYEWYKKRGEALGFLYVAAGPYVRSSYKAGEFYIKSIIKKDAAHS
ncbi:lipoyl synthase [Candidatus Peregrinibacteria bacterium CG11_big_fil_rev_8_21_14_0_20_46_8]|nr:MAG: lipoyl synthase [Candidatus Peregrinibacteria bacterium CG11_big_fil_rev_8_21_14_0_20_46_8]